ncbi:MAG: hypothetical protein ACRCWO_04600 [Bosea sp. (in: a-proteobacteria)]
MQVLKSAAGLFIILAAILLKQAPASAQSSAIPPDPMTFKIIRDGSAVCHPICAEFLVAEGDIVPGSANEFRKVLSKAGKRKLTVLVHSRGGSVEAALSMGRMIRKAGLPVAVANTRLVDCRTTDRTCLEAKARGEPLAMLRWDQAVCASACPLILAGGVKRLVHRRSIVGVHAVRQDRTEYQRRYKVTYRIEDGERKIIDRKLVENREVRKTQVSPEKTSPVYRRIEAYLEEMGVKSKVIMPRLIDTPHEQMAWLAFSELVSSSLATPVNDIDMIVKDSQERQALSSMVILPFEDDAGNSLHALLELTRMTNQQDVLISLKLSSAAQRLDRTLFAAALKLGEDRFHTLAPEMPNRLDTRLMGRMPLGDLCALKGKPVGALVLTRRQTPKEPAQSYREASFALPWIGKSLQQECITARSQKTLPT